MALLVKVMVKMIEVEIVLDSIFDKHKSLS